ncbi:MAG: UDP-N-acetylmuramoyl-L-alanine--D-glutamate ligase, partial [Eubacterium sp.]|nr:UDP-N-acetylmuramoyl-L-alanine--D-glutamate ligase [Eubacterium sp.]
MTLENKNVAVVGLGKSGMAARDLLKKMGARVFLYDGNKDLNTDDYSDPLYLGEFPEKVLSELDCAVFSPGVPLDIPVAEDLIQHDIPIIGEIELAFLCERGQVIGITGTNGKTTTTTLTGEIMSAYKDQCFVVGNIGNPYTKEVRKTSEDSVTVAEISSFQLETIASFRPRVSAILNITPDHLNRHKTMETYIDMKFRVAENQEKDDLCVLNYEDPVLRERGPKLPCKVLYFSSKQPIQNGFYQDENHNIVDGETGHIWMNMSECNIPGDHNCENIMAAILMTREMGVPEEIIVKTVRNFQAVEHRVEFVKTVAGVDYYNDSKGTNPDAAIKGIQSMSKPTVLIGGGYDKGGEFDEWIEAFEGKVKKLLLMGKTRERIAKTCKDHGFDEFEFVDTLQEAVERAAQLTEEGEAVLLSPACASWDMFDSYEQRGRLFKDY